MVALEVAERAGGLTPAPKKIKGDDERMFTLESWKKVWDTKPHLVYIGALALLVIVAIILSQTSYFKPVPVYHHQEVNQQGAQESKPEQKAQEPVPTIPGFNVLKNDRYVTVMDIEKKPEPVVSLAGNLYSKGLLLELHGTGYTTELEGDRSGMITLIPTREYQKMKFMLGQLKRGKGIK